jgi:hypothetical protein
VVKRSKSSRSEMPRVAWIGGNFKVGALHAACAARALSFFESIDPLPARTSPSTFSPSSLSRRPRPRRRPCKRRSRC